MAKYCVLRSQSLLFGLGIAILASGNFGNEIRAEDYFLTIAGGYSPSGNQASLEKNVLFYQRMLTEQNLDSQPCDIFFADGLDNKPSLKVIDLDSTPLANRLMAEFFGSQRNLGLQYRVHQIPNIRGATSVENIDQWFQENASKMHAGDRLILYVSAHGGKSADSKKPYNTTIYLWNSKKISVTQLSDHLDRLPEGVAVVAFMVQCHAGGFAQLFNEHGDPDNPIAHQNRCGFFATVHSRPAAGCTPEIDEANYEEYSTYFLAALAGKNRLGQPIKLPDYDGNGIVSFDEAHAYTVLSANTIDLPIKTSGEYLRKISRFGSDDDSSLLSKDSRFETVLDLAGPADRAVLESLSKQLNLNTDDRISIARKSGAKRTRPPRRRRSSSAGRRTKTGSSERDRLKKHIVNDLRKRWPDLANVLNPVCIELLTSRQDEFVSAIESHVDFARYRELTNDLQTKLSSDKARVKFERFVRTAENIMLAENLQRIGDPVKIADYQRLILAESGSLVGRSQDQLQSRN